jgi:hypothetical protein
MKYAAEMGSGGMVYIPSFIKIGSDIQTLLGGSTNIQTHRQRGDCLDLVSFFKIRKLS